MCVRERERLCVGLVCMWLEAVCQSLTLSVVIHVSDSGVSSQDIILRVRQNVPPTLPRRWVVTLIARKQLHKDIGIQPLIPLIFHNLSSLFQFCEEWHPTCKLTKGITVSYVERQRFHVDLHTTFLWLEKGL